MKTEDLVFDENFENYFSIEQQSDEICLTLSDSLAAVEEDLSEDYKYKIVDFINKSDKWYNEFKGYIAEWAKGEYNIETQQESYVLINVFVLFEQSESQIFGLEFGVDFDEEHNCGLKVRAIEDRFEIFEIGTGDVAFA